MVIVVVAVLVRITPSIGIEISIRLVELVKVIEIGIPRIMGMILVEETPEEVGEIVLLIIEVVEAEVPERTLISGILVGSITTVLIIEVLHTSLSPIASAASSMSAWTGNYSTCSA